MELARLFRGVPMVLSTPSQPRGGVVSDIGFAPQLVIATPAEPRVRRESPAQCEYRAVAILDAWTSLYASGIDAGVDVDRMAAVSLARRGPVEDRPADRETDPVLARSLMLWNSPMLPKSKWRTAPRPRCRRYSPPPPAYGDRRDAVGTMLKRIGALAGGDMATIDTIAGTMPSVLGPVPIPQPRTIDSRELEGTADGSKQSCASTGQTCRIGVAAAFGKRPPRGFTRTWGTAIPDGSEGTHLTDVPST